MDPKFYPKFLQVTKNISKYFFYFHFLIAKFG